MIKRTIHVAIISFIAFVVSATFLSMSESGPIGFLMFSACMVSGVGMIASTVTACIAYVLGD